MFTPGSGPQGAAKVAKVFSKLEKGRSESTRLVRNETELRKIYEDLSNGGLPTNFSPKDGGEAVVLSDGTRIQLRNQSKTGGATVDIFEPGKRPQKIHIGTPK